MPGPRMHAGALHDEPNDGEAGNVATNQARGRGGACDVQQASLLLAATRPRYSVLGSARFGGMPPLEDALERRAAELEVAS